MSDARREFERLARAFAAREGIHDKASACPPAEQLFEAASGGLDREPRLKIVDHVSQCAECTRAWRLAIELLPVGDHPGVVHEEVVVPDVPAELFAGRSDALRLRLRLRLWTLRDARGCWAP